jgi:hypothetical protein
MINILDAGVIFANPLPSVQSIQAQFPGLCRLSDREILCVYKRGTAMSALDCVSCRARSLDGGTTWTDEGPLCDRSRDRRTYSYGYAYPTLLDRQIVVAGYRWDRTDSDDDRNIYNPVTMGAVPCETLLFRSDDGGRRWEPPLVLPRPAGVAMVNASGRIVPLRDGRWLLPLESWKGWDDPAPVKQRSLVMFSGDCGRTWTDPTIVAMDSSHGLLYWNGMFSRIGADRLLAMYWMKDTQTERDLTIRGVISEDEGRTWSEPFETGLEGQMGCTLDVGEGRVLAVFNRRDEERPGVWAAVSRDGGRTWPRDGHAVFWDARGRTQIGDRTAKNRSRSIYDEGTMAFGKPDAINLADGTALVAFWATSNFVSQVRYVRVNIA